MNRILKIVGILGEMCALKSVKIEFLEEFSKDNTISREDKERVLGVINRLIEIKEKEFRKL